MAEEHNIILEYLRSFRAEFDKVHYRLDGIDRRLSSMESHMAGFYNSVTHHEYEH